MLSDLKRDNPKAHAFAKDPSPFSAGLCPRRAGKSYTAALMALVTGLAQPGAITIIVSLNLKQLKRLYWEGGPSGLWAIARRYNIELQPHVQMLKWTLPNGSIGYLMGAEDDEQLEVLRGLEADLYIIDECKSFVPDRLRKLIVEIIAPQRASRKGRLVLIGTPGHVKQGPFYEATCPRAVDEKTKRPFAVDFGKKDPFGRTPGEHRIWSRHHWTLQDNSPMAHQWTEALITKDQNSWSDDNPVWRREYLGEWTESGDGLVFRYAEAKANGNANWLPDRSDDNPTGLPPEGAPWRLIAGLDLGFNDKTALVIAAYSPRLRELRHVVDISKAHMLPDDVADMLAAAIETYGTIEKIYADAGGLGKMVIESLMRKGFPIERAEKREKFDHIELLNSAFSRGEIKVVEGTILEHQLLTNAWNLSKGEFEALARAGRLREDDSIENDSTDAFLYLFRGSLHQFGFSADPVLLQYGSPEWVETWERDQLKKARASFLDEGSRKLGMSPFKTAPRSVQRALTERDRWSPPTRAPLKRS